MDIEASCMKQSRTRDDPENLGGPHSQPRFQFITVSNPASTRDPTTKTVIRKHVMGAVGRAKRLPNKKSKPLIVPLVVPPQINWTRPSLLPNDVEGDEASAVDRQQNRESRRHDFSVSHYSPHAIVRAGSFYNSPHPQSAENERPSPFLWTKAPIAKLDWFGAGQIDPFINYPFATGQSEHAIVAHSKSPSW
jgi:hypothetical protein